MNSFSKIIIAVLVVLLCFGTAHATTNDSQFLEMSRELDFEPKQVVFVAAFDTGRVIEVPGIIVRPDKAASAAGDPNRWWFAARVRVPVGATTIRWFGWVEGARGQFETIDQQSKSLVDEAADDSPATLRKQLAQAQARVKEDNSKMLAQDKEFARMRSEAEVIGNFSRIIDTQEALTRVESELKNLADTSLSIEQFLEQARKFPEPRNARLREQQLVQQLAELAEIAKNAEKEELSRRYRSDREMQHKLDALEAARSDNVDELKKVLRSLQTERAELEAGVL